MPDINRVVANNNYLHTFSVSGKATLYSINLSNCPYLTEIWAYNNALLNSLYCESCPSLTRLSCIKNDLSWLEVTGCDALNDVTCTRNKITGDGMTALVNSLPKRSANEPGSLYVIDKDGEGNTITDAQIAIAQRKCWQPKRFNGYMWVTMTVTLPGDIDGDGMIGINDVSMLIDLILNGDATSETHPEADINFDGQITLVDVTDLIDQIL
jgi:hypothetical protein